MYNSYFGNFTTRTFANIFPDYATFEHWHVDLSGFPNNMLTSSPESQYDLEVVYHLLLAYYANNHIKSSDETRFKLEMSAIIMEHAPMWQRRMGLRQRLMTLSDNDMLLGSRAIYNHATHPNTAPTTDTEQILPFIDDQNVTHYSKGKTDGYAKAGALLEEDITGDFVKKFKKLFITVVYPSHPLLYETNAED